MLWSGTNNNQVSHKSTNVLLKVALLISLSTIISAQGRTWDSEANECAASSARACIVRGYNPGLEKYPDFSHSEICDDSTATFTSTETLAGATEPCKIAVVLSTGECEINGKAGYTVAISDRNEKTTELGTEDSVYGQYTFGVGCARGAWVASEVRI